MCSQPACLCTNSSIELSALPFLFCCVVNTDGRIPEINPALGRPATTLCNVITQTQQFMASTTRNKKKKHNLEGKPHVSACTKRENMEILQQKKKTKNVATPKIQYQKETLSRFDPSNTQSVPCGTRK